MNPVTPARQRWMAADAVLRCFLPASVNGVRAWSEQPGSTGVAIVKTHRWLEHAPSDYFRQLAASTLAQARAGYEQYLWGAAAHLVASRGAMLGSGSSVPPWTWEEASAFFDAFANTPMPDNSIAAVYRIEEDLIRSGATADDSFCKDLQFRLERLNLTGPLGDAEAALGLVDDVDATIPSPLVVWRMLDLLDDRTRSVAAALEPLLDSTGNEHLDALADGNMLPIRRFRRSLITHTSTR
ncbi:hypothetical protein NY551_00445 [Curtobacterium flaccumfaciens pv. oortii]|uniref:hypothetical protein n=1 Tax=Curtobacterium flaccumfaciens TaxID=2035 RepID=UPI002657F276|nr:hypothetical protein [Curtobacterium flaccumfaciens]MCS5521200.1 hypothetical protein [Curtobacterium flaccumfaciens pv. oortii]